MKETRGLVLSILCINSIGFADWAYDTLHSLSLRQKIAQLFMVAVATVPGEDPFDSTPEMAAEFVVKYGIGGIIFMKGVAEKQIAATNYLQSKATIPLLIGQDGEWGLAMRLSDIAPLPQHMTLGAVSDADLIFKTGQELARQCAIMGVHIPFAPVVDSNTNPRNPIIHTRSFGDTATHVSKCGAVFAQGLQSGGVLSCAKHFPGHGDTAVDSHYALPVVTRDQHQLAACELIPFTVLIQEGIDAIMVGHLYIPALDPVMPASLSRTIVTDLLRTELQFSGLIFSDGLRMGALQEYGTHEQIELFALQAGVDVLLCPAIIDMQSLECSITTIEKAVHSESLPMHELDAHVLRILTAKQSLGLTDNRFVDEHAFGARLFSSDAELLKQAVFSRAVAVCKGAVLDTDTCQPCAIASIGNGDNGFVAQCIALFGMDRFDLVDPKNISAEQQAEMVAQMYNHIVFALFPQKNARPYERITVPNELEPFIDALLVRGVHVSCVLFVSPYTVSTVEKSDDIIIAYENNTYAYKAVIDLLLQKKQVGGNR